MYADDLAIACQAKQFELMESRMTEMLDTLRAYYAQNSLLPELTKTVVSAVNLKHNEEKRMLKM